MKKSISFFYIVIASLTAALAQVNTTPEFPTESGSVTIIYDASQGTSSLQSAEKVYMHAGVVTTGPNGTTWNHVVGNWGQDDGIGQMQKVEGSNTLWQITLTPREYFNVPEGETVYRIGMVFREGGPCGASGQASCKEGKSPSNGDIFVTIYQEGINISLSSPSNFPLFVNSGQVISISGSLSISSQIDISIDGNEVFTSGGDLVDTFLYEHTAEASGSHQVIISAMNTDDSTGISFSYTVRSPSEESPKPAGVKHGINYTEDPTQVILSLLAPQKDNVYVVGDFTDWQIDEAYKMKKDGETFWLEITGLTPNKEYVFQYLIDESIYVADPFSEKVLDPDDRYIPSETYPNLESIPPQALKENWMYNRFSVLQTNQTEYQWQVNDFQKPEKKNLIIYELLVRDFFGPNNGNYQKMIDTLGYFKELGVNAIELMPIMEFNGNDSWGYNPTFMFSVDKAYGTKNKLKEFIDEAHKMGIAVILDMVLNQNDLPAPYLLMHWDAAAGKPSINNPWFNRDATHPFNVFFDFNHGSVYTQNFVDTICHYWLNEFRFDGYRFDLSKGFTQKFSGTDVGAWSAYDASRISILKRMADKIWAHSPDAYVILEHFADNSEEIELSDYGMMLWGNMHWAYKEANLGYAEGKSFSGTYYLDRGWSNEHLISYMESHDEERQMVDMLLYGDEVPGYSVRETDIALNRLKQAAAFLYLVPGPKMLWQFAEFGYDVSINENGRTGAKPSRWEYLEDPERLNTWKVHAEIFKLRNAYPTFTEGDFTWETDGNVKQMNYSHTDFDAVVVGNFNVETESVTLTLGSDGPWFDYFSGESITLADASFEKELEPGEFHILTSKQLPLPTTEGLVPWRLFTPLGIANEMNASIYPNPFRGAISLKGDYTELEVSDMLGRKVDFRVQKINDLESRIIISDVRRGMYLVKVQRGYSYEVYKAYSLGRD